MIKHLVTPRKSVIFSLVIVFMAILLPIYMLAFGLYVNAIATLERDAVSAARTRGQLMMQKLDWEVDQIKRFITNMVNNENLINLRLMSKTMGVYDRSAAMLDLIDTIRDLHLNTPLIQDVSLLLPTVGKKLSAYNGVQLLDMDEYESLFNDVINRDTSPYIRNDFLRVNYSNRQTQGSSRMALSYVIDAQLSRSMIIQRLRELDIENNGKSIMVLKDSNYLVAYTPPITHELSKQLLDNLAKGPLEDQSRVQLEDGDTILLKVDGGSSGMVLYMLLSEKIVFQSVHRYVNLFVILSIFALCVLVLYFLFTYLRIYRPLNELTQAFYEISHGNLDKNINFTRDDEFGTLYTGFNTMTKQINNLVNQVYRQKILSQRAELKQLQSQINPHFLYNSFFILSRMIITDREGASLFAKQLATYFKFITRNAADQVPLIQEIEHARVYANMQDLRFSRRIELRFETCPEDYSQVVVPRLILQPVIENAYEHGLHEKEEYGILQITFEERCNRLLIHVEDNGEMLSDEKLYKLETGLTMNELDMEYTGLLNIHRRMQLAMGDESGLTINRSALGGLCVTLTIPNKGVNAL